MSLHSGENINKEILFLKMDDNKDGLWTGMEVHGGIENCDWRIECPCGVIKTFKINEFPLIDVHMGCDKPNHWAVRYED